MGEEVRVCIRSVEQREETEVSGQACALLAPELPPAALALEFGPALQGRSNRISMSDRVFSLAGRERTFMTIWDESNWPSLSPCEADLTSPSILRVSPQEKSSMFQYE
jgi:hypothetical protein